MPPKSHVDRPVRPEAAQDGADIVVTAQKIEQRAKDVPITISAVTGARIAAA